MLEFGIHASLICTVTPKIGSKSRSLSCDCGYWVLWDTAFHNINAVYSVENIKVSSVMKLTMWCSVIPMMLTTIYYVLNELIHWYYIYELVRCETERTYYLQMSLTATHFIPDSKIIYCKTLLNSGNMSKTCYFKNYTHLWRQVRTLTQYRWN